jgi:NitT/TauT family transport system ATP-binding protein
MSPADFQSNLESNGSQKLVLSTVTKVYETAAAKTRVAALSPISMAIRKGEFAVFVGPSGCGKTTLLNLIAGFIAPSTGSIHLDGSPVGKPGPDRLMMFQEHALFPWLNVIDNVMFGLRRNWFRPSLRRERARELLRMMHLEQFEKADIHELSGGMKQRVALARALAPDPSVLLIDEPFHALDAVVKLELYAELQRIHQATRKTIIFVTHEMQEAACLGDRVFVFSGSPGQITHEVNIQLPRPREFNDPKVVEFAVQLMDRLKENNQNRKT